MTKNFPDSKCAADSNLILAKCETEYLPPVGIFWICSRIKLLSPAAGADVASRASPINAPIVFNSWNCGGRRPRLQIRPQPRTAATTIIDWATTLAKIDIMLRFTKMNGAGNDFVMIDNRAGNVRLEPEQIVRICDRHRGVGADGILLLEKGSNGADFRMRYYNRARGEAEMCGNRARGVARFATKVAGAPERISFQTPAGLIVARLHGDLVTLQMSEPKDLRLGLDVVANGAKEHVHFINSGVPTLVVPVSKVVEGDVRR